MFAWLKNLFFRRSRDRYVSEEELLIEDTERLDREHPGWFHNGYVAGACAALENGMERESVVAGYGEAIVQEAERMLKTEQKPQ